MTAPRVTKNSFTLTRENAKRLTQAALSGCSRDDVTPVICAALLTVEGSTVRASVTDRYRVHTALIDLDAKTKAHEFLIPLNALLWLDKNIAIHGRFMAEHNRIVIASNSEGALTITVMDTPGAAAQSVAWAGQVRKGNFPPILRLIEKARTAKTVPAGKVRLDWINKAGVLAKHKEFPPALKFTASENPNKPGPLYLAFTDDDSTEPYAEAVIQPILPIFPVRPAAKGN